MQAERSLKAVLQTSARVFVVPIFSRSTARLQPTASPSQQQSKLKLAKRAFSKSFVYEPCRKLLHRKFAQEDRQKPPIPAGAGLCVLFYFFLKMIFIDSGWAVENPL